MFTSITSVLLFPGQGGYDERFLSELALRHPEVGLAFGEIDEVSARFGGRSISDQLLRGRTPSLDVLLSENPDLLQLAIYGTSVSAFRVATAEGIRGDVFAGHSFGEVAALVAAGAYSIREGAEIVFRRNVVLSDTAIGPGAMLAVAADRQRIERILDVIGDPYTVIAVENGPTQTVVAGPKAAITAIGTITAALRINTKLLASPYPFHSPMLAKGVGELSRQLHHLPGGPLLTPVYSPMLGRYLRPTDHLGEYLAGGLVNPVWFGAALRKLHDDGARSFLECGAGRALSGIVARNLPGVTVTSLAPGDHPAAPAADAVAQPVQVARRSRADVFSEVASMYASALEYPVEVFTDAVALEADLGIDSMKQTELLARTAETYSLPELPSDIRLSDYDTMGKVVDFVVSFDKRVEIVAIPVAADTPIDSGGGRRRTRAEVFSEVASMYASALEYPVEVFTDAVALEADLGIDSMKQTELLARTAETYSLPGLPSDIRLSDYDTMGKVVDFVLAYQGPAESRTGNSALGSGELVAASR